MLKISLVLPFLAVLALVFLGSPGLAGAIIFFVGLILLMVGFITKCWWRALGGILTIVTGGVYVLGTGLEFEFPFSPTLWLASRTSVNGTNMVELVRLRSGGACTDQHWHHCTWCDVVYPHAPHLAVRINIDINDLDFYLFDWDPSRGRLLPASVRTAKVFPELIPNGYVVEPLGVGLNPQLYSHDEPCRIEPQGNQKTNARNSLVFQR